MLNDLNLLAGETAVNHQARATAIRGLFRSQEKDGLSHLLWRALTAQGNRLPCYYSLFFRRLFILGYSETPQGCVYQPWGDAVHPDVVAAVPVGHVFGQLDYRRLGCVVGP